MTVHTTKGFNSPKIEENRFDRIATTAQTCQDVHSQEDVKQKEQLEHDAKNILDLTAPGVTGKDLNDLMALVGEFRNVFAVTNKGLGCVNVVEHGNETGNSPSIKIPPRWAGLP